MKAIILILTLSSFIFASSDYLFLVKKYNKDIELEAQIISEISTNIITNEEVKLFIPNITDDEKEIYSKLFQLANECDANFIFKKRDYNFICEKNQIYFTNNYNKLISDAKYIGAFFWSKSRPNIVFIKSRLNKNSLILPITFNKFVEDF